MKIVDGKPYIDQIKGLIEEYTKRLGRDLTFQNLEEELADPAKKYTAPEGELLVAFDGDKVVGMVAYHRHSADRCEMKRLYVRPECREAHLGKTLVREIVEHASRAGYAIKRWYSIPLNRSRRPSTSTGRPDSRNVSLIMTIPWRM